MNIQSTKSTPNLVLDRSQMRSAPLIIQPNDPRIGAFNKPITAPATPSANPMEAMFKVMAEMMQGFMKLIENLLQRLLPANAASGSAEPSSAIGRASPQSASSPGAPGSQEFLWKPASEKNGNLVVLLPARLTGNVAELNVVSQDGTTIASGSDAGVGNESREHFRFSRPGSSFPDNVVVEVLLNDGSVERFPIAQSSRRTSVTRRSAE